MVLVDFEMGVKENSGLDTAGLGDLRELSGVEWQDWVDTD